jgi:hypothetical protein
MRNGNKPRIIFLRILGLLITVLGLILATILMLSRQSQFLRIICIVFWWPGLAVTFAAFRGLCIVLHFRSARDRRPWEQFGDPEHGYDVKPRPDESDKDSESRPPSRKGRAAGASNTPSLRPFGPKNDCSQEPWVRVYAKKSLLSKVFEASVPVRNPSLQILQDRTAFLSIAGGGFLAMALTVGWVFIPPQGIIL